MHIKYFLLQAGAEKSVSFETGADGSIAEDFWFSVRAYNQGYSFNFIEGEVWEKSPFTVKDYIHQRMRWFQGSFLLAFTKSLPLRQKVGIIYSFSLALSAPLLFLNGILIPMYPVQCPRSMELIFASMAALSVYMFIFGAVKSYLLYPYGTLKLLLCIILSPLFGICSGLMFNVAVIVGLFSKKHSFHVVDKLIKPQTSLV